jgi:hypothetical protein
VVVRTGFDRKWKIPQGNGFPALLRCGHFLLDRWSQEPFKPFSCWLELSTFVCHSDGLQKLTSTARDFRRGLGAPLFTIQFALILSTLEVIEAIEKEDVLQLKLSSLSQH